MKRGLRIIGICSLLLFIASWPLSYVYYRWDDSRIIKEYGGNTSSDLTAVTFLGTYLESRLRDGMTKVDVHLVINKVKFIDSYRQSSEIEMETFWLDPLETLFIQVEYENGVYKASPNVDRDFGYDGWIKIITALCGFVFLLGSVFVPLSRRPVR
jgi:hypothetical protein